LFVIFVVFNLKSHFYLLSINYKFLRLIVIYLLKSLR
jgi:hypothetical protein